MVWRAASGAGSTISGPTSGPQFSLTTSPSSPGSSRSDSRLRQTLAGPADPGSISHSDFAPFAADQPSQSPDGSKWHCKPLSFGNKRSSRSQQKQTLVDGH